MLARMLMSVTVMPVSVGFDVQQPATVRRYFEQYAVRGLLGSP